MSSPTPNDSSKQPDRLNGWKEIASYLGKGVRTVQRWERLLDLPVHRLGREGGEIVFALRSELDAWALARAGNAEAAERDAGKAPGVEPPVVELSAIPPTQANERRRWRPAVIAAACVILSAALAMPVLRRHPNQPAGFRIANHRLVVLDSKGQELWTKDFPGPIALSVFLNEERPGVRFTDIDGDGKVEVLFAARLLDKQSRSQAIWVYNWDGSERFHYAPAGTVRFGSDVYSAPWLARDVWAQDEGDGNTSIWATFIHSLQFPSLLVELNAKGEVVQQYWSGGYIERVLVTRWGGRSVVLVGATNNETKGASVAVFERRSVAGASPAQNPSYRCEDCGPGGPRAFLVFPRRCIGIAAGGTATADDMIMEGRDVLHVLVSEGKQASSGAFSSSVWYSLQSDFGLEGVEILPHVPKLHAEMEKAGLLDHPFDQADAERVFPVLEWATDHFMELPRAPVRW